MILSKFSLINFRQFKNVELEFSQDPDKPFTIITGGNTYGKTTLVKAFLWCLYGDKNFNDKILLNKDVADSMYSGDSKEVRATLHLNHAGYDYKITTSEWYEKNSSNEIRVKYKTGTSVMKMKDGKTTFIKTDDEIKDEIESILDQELSPYFFFDGENNNIETITSKKNLTNAVSEIMGIKKTEALLEYFKESKPDNVIKRFQSKLDTSDPLEVQNLVDKRDEYSTKIEIKTEEINTNDEEIDKLTIQLEEKEKELNDNKTILDLQEEKQDLYEDLNEYLNEKDKSSLSIFSLLKEKNTLLNSLYAYNFVKNNNYSELLKTTFLTDKNLSHITEEAIDEIIKRGYCLCGTIIKEKSDAYNHLIEQKDYVEPRNYNKHIDSFIESEKVNLNYYIDKIEKINQLCDEYIDDVSELEKIQDKISDILKEIEGKPNVGEIQKEYNNISEQIANLKGASKYINEKVIPELEKNIIDLNDKIDELSQNSEKNVFVQECIKYAKKIFSMANKKVTDEKIKIRQNLERTVGEVFAQMYTGKRKIVIDENFKVSTRLMDSSYMDTSKGLETVMNFSFVTGLMKLIKDKLIEEDSKIDNFFVEEDVDVNYPLVMDAPFSSTDEKHISNICSTLPKYCSQIIIIVMDKDFKMAKNQVLEKAGRKYKISKHSETFAEVEEVEIDV